MPPAHCEVRDVISFLCPEGEIGEVYDHPPYNSDLTTMCHEDDGAVLKLIVKYVKYLKSNGNVEEQIEVKILFVKRSTLLHSKTTPT